MKGKHLSRHRRNYYFRRSVPKDLRSWFSGKEIKRSLKSKSLTGCRTLLQQWAAQLEGVFIKIRTRIFKPEEIKAIIARTPLFSEMNEPPIRTDFFMPIPAEGRLDVSNPDTAPTEPCQLGVNPLPPSVGLEPVKEPPKAEIGEIYKQYIHEYEVSERWTEKTRKEVESIFRLFNDIVGYVPVAEIDHQMLLNVRDKLLRLPANIKKKAEFRGKTVAEILHMKDVKPMSTARVSKILSRMNAFFKWCHTHRYVKEVVSAGLALPKRRQEHEERSVYSDEDIGRMFRSPLFARIENPRPDRFWVPLIGLFSGMRLNEICQLYAEDVKEVDGIWCLDVNTEKDKILKNLSSKRLVPIHSALLEIGFLKYVEKMRKEGNPRLWMGLNPRRDGYGHSFSNFWQRYNRQFITKDPKKVFHSFRHSLANSLKQKGVSDSFISEILGHAIDSITLGRYGKKYQPGLLLKELEKVTHKMDVERLKKIADSFLTGVVC